MIIYKTDQDRTYIVVEEGVVSSRVSKCTGYFLEGIFIGMSVLDRREFRGSDLESIKNLLNDFFKVVYRDRVMERIKKRFS